MSIVAGYNLVVDSNVTSPSSYAPSVATVMGKFCNTGDADLTGVRGYIGTYSPGAGTPGVYPTRDSSAGGFKPTTLAGTGLYSFTHIGGRIGLADATRFIGTIPPGECRTQYWHFTYPRRGNPNNTGPAVWGLSNDPTDDLWLNFDIWGRDGIGGEDSATHKMTMRNEISAMANKIYPNGGTWFNTSGDHVLPGQTITSNGVHYELGSINKGFDNDGNFTYDYNAWLQPIGDPSYDPSCFRLVKTEGTITIKRSGGQPNMIIDFTDQLYFTNLPQDNAGGYGDIKYTFLALAGPCSTGLTPYQEVASGADNEKFNADYGATMPPVGSYEPEVEVTKDGASATLVPGNTNTYTINVKNNGGSSAGNADWGVPLVITDTVTAGTEYQAGSATSTAGVTILYSTDNGLTWSTTEPVPATLVTDVQWWFEDPLAAGADEDAVITIKVPVGYGGASVGNCATASFGNGDPFFENCETTILQGTYTLGDRVWADLNGDGIQDAGETGISNVQVKLYVDLNNDNAYDSGDLLVGTQTTNGSGIYTFSNVAAGEYVVVVDTSSAGIPANYDPTTATTLAKTVSGNVTDADFGFAPALSLDKALTSGSPAYEGSTVTYSITLSNTRPGDGLGGGTTCNRTETLWSTAGDPDSPTGSTAFASYTNAYAGPPDGSFASDAFNNNSDFIEVTGFGTPTVTGTITKVEALYHIYLTGVLVDDKVNGMVYFGNTQQGTTKVFNDATNHLTDPFAGGIGNQGLLVWDVTSLRAWALSDFAGDLDLRMEVGKTGGKDNQTIYLDAMALRITTSYSCSSAGYIATVPLTDTYDASRLQFISASPIQDSATTGGSSPYANTGTITWNDLGPLYPGGSQVVDLTFKALEPPDNDADGENDAASTTDEAKVSGAKYDTGKTIPDITDTAVVTVNPTGNIGDTIWNDNGAGGGIYGNGVKDGGELGIPNVTVSLYTDPNGDGDPADGVLKDTKVTNASGQYLFEGLTDGNYVVVVNTTTLPWTIFTQKGDPEYPGVACVGAQCNNRGSAVLNNNNGSTSGDNVLTVDFGYVSTKNAVNGYIWNDVDADGVWDLEETAISGVTVRLYDSLNALIGTTTTDVNGKYEFKDLDDATYYVLVDNTVAPLGATWVQTYDPDGATKDNKKDNFVASNGTIYGAYNFGYRNTGLSSIGDTIYVDWNGNGAQDAGEEGISGVTVTLYLDRDGDGVIDIGTDPFIGTDTTDANGLYSFDNLPAGDYIVAVNETLIPANYTQTQDPDEAGICTTCNALGSSTITGSAPGDLTVDFGYKPTGTGSIGDTVWNDANKNGVQDPGETGIAAIRVTLYEDSTNNGVIDIGTDAAVAYTDTDASGHYLFTGLAAGNYLVDVDTNDADLPTDGYANRYVLSSNNDPHDVTLLAGAAYLTADFGFAPGAVVGDFIWRDSNRNGTTDEGEPGLANITVNLYNDTNNNGTYEAGIDTLYQSTSTNASGYYTFTSLPEGKYILIVDTSDPDLPSTIITSDPDETGKCVTCDGRTALTLSAGQVDLSRDFGFQSPGGIGDQVWIDSNGNGIKETAEAGIPNVTVWLYDATGTTLLNTTTTNSDGLYSFSTGLGGASLSDGSYQVWINPATLPADTTQVYDPDVANPCSGPTCDNKGTVTITGGSLDMNMDFGYKYVGAFDLSGTVFRDVNNNTIYDAGDGTFSGVTLYLWSSTGTPMGSAVTDASGDYSFTSLPAGTYYVTIDDTAPILYGLTRTTPTPNPYLTATIGPSATDLDFGFFGATTSLGDFLWFDIDGDGNQDAGEPGIANVTVALYIDQNNDHTIDGGDTLLGTQTTNSNGEYLFLALPPDDYLVTVTDTNGVLTGATRTGGTDPHSVALAAGIEYLTADFGYDGIRKIGDFVWFDTDSDGNQDGGEPGIAGVTLDLYWDTNNDGTIDGGDINLGTQTTNGSGIYNFTGLIAGNYLVDVTDTGAVLTSYSLTTGSTDPHDVTLTAGADYLAADFGYSGATTSIGDLVWFDVNGDSVRDANEPGIPNVTVALYNDLGVVGTYEAGTDTLYGSQTTDSSGGYLFVSPPAGYYVVRVTDTNNVLTGATLTGGTDPKFIDLSGGGDDLTADFGYTGVRKIGDFVWLDLDSDGTQDAGEPGISGVTIDLYWDTNNDGAIDGGDFLIDTQTTDATGIYNFTNLIAGNYLADVTDTGAVLTGYSLTTGSTDPHDITLVTGADNLTADFGYTGSRTVGDFVWLDLDSDGTQDAGEPGISGVTIELYWDADNSGTVNAGDFLVGTKTTDASGNYSFTNLPAGDYLVDVTDTGAVLTGYSLTTGSTDPHDVTLTSGADYLTADFGYVGSRTIGDFVWLDLDADGTQDAGEPGISGVTIDLYWDADNSSTINGGDFLVSTKTTDASGNYTFTGLPAGNYLVDVTDTGVVLTGYSLTTGSTDPHDVTLTAGADYLTADFGYASSRQIGDFIWLDLDADGTQDAGEPGISGVTVNLYWDADNSGTVNAGDFLVGTKTTDASGNYTFTGLPAGNYLVDVTDTGAKLTGYSLTTGSTDPHDVTLTSGADYLTADFGYVGSRKIGDYVWYDTDQDGVQDGTETGVVGVTIDLYWDADNSGTINAGDFLIGTQTTDALGNYSFNNLPPGNYLVDVTDTGAVLTGFSLTTGSTDPRDVILTAGADYLAADFGYNQSGEIHGQVREDVDRDGVLVEAPADSGLSGITIRLYTDPNGDGNPTDGTVIQTTVTDSNGDYEFIGVFADNYVVVETDLTGYYSTNDITAPNDNQIPVTLAAGAISTGNDFLDAQIASIGDYVWNDVNADGVQDGGELGLGLVTVRLFSDPNGDGNPADGTLLATTATAGDGSYHFPALAFGSYVVVVDGSTLPANYYLTTANEPLPVVLSIGLRYYLTADFGYRLGVSGMTKTVLTSNLPNTTGANVAIGEILTYQLQLTYNPGTFPSQTVTDILDQGMAFMDCDPTKVTASDPLLTTSLGPLSSICAPLLPPNQTLGNPGIFPQPLGDIDPDNQGRRIVFNLGNITNSSGSDQVLTIEYRVIVLNIKTNQGGDTRTNRASGNNGSLNVTAAPIDLVEPDIQISKKVIAPKTNPGAVVTYRLTVGHTNKSSADAFNVTITDTIPTQLIYVPGSLKRVSGQVPTLLDDSTAPILTVQWDFFQMDYGPSAPFTETTVIEYQAMISLIPEGTKVKNAVLADWTTLPGDMKVAQSPYNVESNERWNDPANSIDDIYNDASDVQLVAIGKPSFGLPGTGFAPGIVTALLPQPFDKSYSDLGALTLEIPSLDVKTRIIGIPLNPDGWDLSWLWDQAGYLDGTAFPTTQGDSVITAHVYTPDGLPGPFVNLSRLSWGDKIIVTYNGQRHTYEVRNNTLVRPQDVSAITHETGRSWVTLLTCERYQEKGNKYRMRRIVQAVLASIE